MIKKKILIIGATSTIAHECARELNNQFICHFTLVGRNRAELEKNKADLMIRSNRCSADVVCVNFFNSSFLGDIENILKKSYDFYILAQGNLVEHGSLTIDTLSKSNQLNINSYANLIFIIYERLKKINRGHLILFGSVAGDRGKQSNFWYGASKSYINTVFQGIEHDIGVNNRNINISIIKPGPTLTKMTIHLPNAHKFAKADEVAKEIVKQIKVKKRVIYVPRKWKWIMLIIKYLPQFIFDKLKI